MMHQRATGQIARSRDAHTVIMDLHISICSCLARPSRGGRFLLQNQIQDCRVLASKYDKQDHEHRAEKIGIQRQVHGTALDYVEALLDDHAVCCGDRTGDAEANAQKSHRRHQ